MLSERPKHKLHRSISVLLALMVGFAAIPYGNVDAATSATLNNLQKNLNALQAKQKDIEAKISGLESDKENEQKKYDEYLLAIENVKSQIAIYQQQIDAMNQEISQKNAEIEQKNAEISQKNAEIEQKNTEIEQKNLEIEQKQADISENYEEFKERLSAMYMASAGSSSMGVLFGAESFSDFLTHAEAIKNISERDNQIMDNLMVQKRELQDLKTQLEEKKTEIEGVKSEIEARKIEVEGKKAEIESQRNNVVAVQSQEQTKEGELNNLIEKSAAVVENLEAQQAALDEQNEELDAEREKAIAAIIAEQERIRLEEEARRKAEEEARKKAEQEAAANGQPSNSNNSTQQNKPSNNVTIGSGWVWPTPTYSYVSQYYSSGHKALDIAAGAGNPILASRGGTVVFSGFGSAANGFNRYGNVILISHGDGYYSLYAHCSALYVSTGASVSQGQKIAAVGNTGQSFGNHLHFEIRTGVQGTRLNPSNFVSAPR